MSSPCNYDYYRVCKTPNSCTPRQGDEELKEELCPDPKTETPDPEKSRYVVNFVSTVVSAILAGYASKTK
ncbi:MAG TPA: hypothetical protein VLJ37_08845 [bacterium]|nr:hypothetical protein [bacterium]